MTCVSKVDLTKKKAWIERKSSSHYSNIIHYKNAYIMYCTHRNGN